MDSRLDKGYLQPHRNLNNNPRFAIGMQLGNRGMVFILPGFSIIPNARLLPTGPMTGCIIGEFPRMFYHELCTCRASIPGFMSFDGPKEDNGCVFCFLAFSSVSCISFCIHTGRWGAS